jgi:hypothetical protein
MMRFKPEGLLGGHSKRRYKMPKDVRSDYQWVRGKQY